MAAARTRAILSQLIAADTEAQAAQARVSQLPVHIHTCPQCALCKQLRVLSPFPASHSCRVVTSLFDAHTAPLQAADQAEISRLREQLNDALARIVRFTAHANERHFIIHTVDSWSLLTHLPVTVHQRVAETSAASEAHARHEAQRAAEVAAADAAVAREAASAAEARCRSAVEVVQAEALHRAARVTEDATVRVATAEAEAAAAKQELTLTLEKLKVARKERRAAEAGAADAQATCQAALARLEAVQARYTTLGERSAQLLDAEEQRSADAARMSSQLMQMTTQRDALQQEVEQLNARVAHIKDKVHAAKEAASQDAKAAKARLVAVQHEADAMRRELTETTERCVARVRATHATVLSLTLQCPLPPSVSDSRRCVPRQTQVVRKQHCSKPGRAPRTQRRSPTMFAPPLPLPQPAPSGKLAPPLRLLPRQ